jgi:hypothetical protein
MTVRELMERVDSFELTEWETYWRLEPFGDEWEKTAATCEAIMVAAGHTKVDRNIWRPSRREKPQQSQAEMDAEIAKIGAFMAAAAAAASRPPAAIQEARADSEEHHG